MPTKNNKIVQAEIVKLKELKPCIRPTTAFGDSNTDAIQAQIDTLENRYDSDDAYANFEDEDEGVGNAAIRAAQWLESSDAGSLAAEWEELVIK